MKKVVAIILALMLLSLCLVSCSSEQTYDKANTLFAEGKYKEAYNVFKGLGDYEDSMKMAEKCAALAASDKFMKYVEANGRLLYDGGTYSIAVTAAGDTLKIEYSVNATESAFSKVIVGLTATLKLGEKTAEVSGASSLVVLNARINDTANGKWNISSYKTGDIIEWDKYEINGTNEDGTPLAQNTSGLLAATDDVLVNALSGMAEALSHFLSESKTGVTMPDMGFKQFN